MAAEVAGSGTASAALRQLVDVLLVGRIACDGGYPGKLGSRGYLYVESLDLRADDERREGQTHLRHVIPRLTGEPHKP